MMNSGYLTREQADAYCDVTIRRLGEANGLAPSTLEDIVVKYSRSIVDHVSAETDLWPLSVGPSESAVFQLKGDDKYVHKFFMNKGDNLNDFLGYKAFLLKAKQIAHKFNEENDSIIFSYEGKNYKTKMRVVSGFAINQLESKAVKAKAPFIKGKNVYDFFHEGGDFELIQHLKSMGGMFFCYVDDFLGDNGVYLGDKINYVDSNIKFRFCYDILEIIVTDFVVNVKGFGTHQEKLEKFTL